MKHTLRILILTLFAAVVPSWAGLVLALDPAGGIINIEAGSVGGWGFTFTADDANYYVLSSVEFCLGFTAPGIGACNSTPVGNFTDYASNNGLIIGPGYSTNPYSEIFSSTLFTGLGSYFVYGTTAPQSLGGYLYVYYDVYDGDPGNGGNQILAGQSVSPYASVGVTAADNAGVPEPSSLWLVSLAACGLLVRKRLNVVR